MPALLAASWFVPLLTAVGAGTSLATTGYELASQPGSSQPTAAANNTAAQQAAAQKAQQTAAILAQSGNTQAQTGGSLTPESFATVSAKSAGAPSDLNSIMQFLAGNGGSGGGSSAPVSGGITTPNSGGPQSGDPNNLQNLSDLLKAA